MSVRWALAAAGIYIITVSGCGGGLRTVPVGPRGAAGAPPIVVDTAPPTPKVEPVPADPGKPCAWLDGRWEWTDQAWAWAPGGWVVIPPGCHYATPQALWVPAKGRGLLFYLPGRWYRDSDGTGCTEPTTCPG